MLNIENRRLLSYVRFNYFVFVFQYSGNNIMELQQFFQPYIIFEKKKRLQLLTDWVSISKVFCVI